MKRPAVSALRMPRLLVGAIVAVAGVLGLGGSAAAVEQHIAITPSSQEIKLAPGGSSQQKVTIVNQGSGDFDIEYSAAPYSVAPDDAGYEPKFEAGTNATDVTSWIKLSKTKDSAVSPSKVAELEYTVRVPSDAKPGSYAAVVFAKTSPTEKPSQGVVAHNRVGQIVYIDIAGTVEESGEIVAGKTTSFTMNGEVRVEGIVKNTGGRYFKSAYTAKITSLFGKTVFEESKDMYVLPQTQRKVEAKWTTSDFLGIYKISRTAETPSGTQTLADSWVVSVQPLTLLVVLAVLIGSGVLAIKRRR